MLVARIWLISSSHVHAYKFTRTHRTVSVRFLLFAHPTPKNESSMMMWTKFSLCSRPDFSLSASLLSWTLLQICWHCRGRYFRASHRQENAHSFCIAASAVRICYKELKFWVIFTISQSVFTWDSVSCLHSFSCSIHWSKSTIVFLSSIIVFFPIPALRSLSTKLFFFHAARICPFFFRFIFSARVSFNCFSLSTVCALFLRPTFTSCCWKFVIFMRFYADV